MKDVEIEKGKSLLHQKNQKEDKEIIPLELMEDNFERSGDQFKEIVDDVFQCMVKQQEGLNRKIQEEMVALYQLMEATMIENVSQTTEGPTKRKTRLVEERPTLSHALEVTQERGMVKLAPGVISFPSVEM
jgi:Na+/phosphate symporter